MKKKVVYSIIIIMLVFTSCTIGGSFYMLNFSLTRFLSFYVQKLSLPASVGG